MSTPDPALSALLSPPPGRANALRGRLPTAPRTAIPEPPPGPEPAAAAPSAPAEPRRWAVKSQRSEQQASPIRVVPARIPGSLFARVNQERAKTAETHEMWFLAAWGRVDDQLDDHYRPPATTGRVPQRARRGRRPPGEPLTQYPLRLTEEEADALYERAAELRPSSIAELVTTIVALALAAQEKRRDG
jgi:hypothetical protein